jgi:hypothetical protein
MSAPVRITNGGQGQTAEIFERDDENGLLVFTKNRDSIQLQTKPLLNPALGLGMNIDASSTPSTIAEIYDGGDNAYWTPSAISGTWDFVSTAQAHTGTKSIDATATVNGSTAKIDKGSTLALSPYETFDGWIYITSWPSSGTKDVTFELWDASDVLVGNSVAVSGYIDTGLFGVWQNFSIPLIDMGLSAQTIQSLAITTIDIGGGQPPNYYLDDLQLQDTGSGVEFCFEADDETQFHIERVKLFIRDAYTATSSGQHAFDSSGILGLSTLTNGILAGRSVDGDVSKSAIIKDIGDWFRFPQAQNVSSGGNGTNTWVMFDLAYETEGGLVLDSRTNDKFFFRIRDDLSGLLDFTGFAEGYIIRNDVKNPAKQD